MPERFSFFGGIDFSGAKEPLANLWTAVGREEEGRLQIVSLRPHAFRADLASFVGEGWRGAASAGGEERILWGVDCPLGLPSAAVRHLLRGESDWRRLLAWVADRPAEEVRDAVPEELRGPRLTDGGGALSPFDVRLYKQTVEGMRWLYELMESVDLSVHPQAAREDAPLALVEVYPSSTVQELGLPRRRAPSRPGETRARAAALRTFLRFRDPEHEAIAVSLEDAWDATIASLSAFLVRDDLEQPFRTSTHSPSALRLEGWIYRPPAALR